MTREEILHLADLARVKMSEEEIDRFREEIGSILTYVGKVNDIVADTELKKTPGPVKNVFRADEVRNVPGTYTEEVVSAFPSRSGNYLKVQKILNPDSDN